MMHPIPEIIENKIAPPKLLSKVEPMKKPTIPTRIIIMTETMVLSFFILTCLHKSRFASLLYLHICFQKMMRFLNYINFVV